MALYCYYLGAAFVRCEQKYILNKFIFIFSFIKSIAMNFTDLFLVKVIDMCVNSQVTSSLIVIPGV